MRNPWNSNIFLVLWILLICLKWFENINNLWYCMPFVLGDDLTCWNHIVCNICRKSRSEVSKSLQHWKGRPPRSNNIDTNFYWDFFNVNIHWFLGIQQLFHFLCWQGEYFNKLSIFFHETKIIIGIVWQVMIWIENQNIFIFNSVMLLVKCFFCC